MKKILPVFMCFLISLASEAQQVYDTIPFIPEYHQKRLVLFSHESTAKGAYIFLGNSITEFGNWRKLVGDSSVVNRGIAGDVTFGVLKRLDDVIARTPSKLFIEVGINDVAKGIPAGVIAKNIATIALRVHAGSPKTILFVYSLLPVNETAKAEYPEVYEKKGDITRVNKYLEENARHAGYRYVNLYPLFSDNTGSLKAEYSVDGLHLNETGYRLWAGLMKKNKYW